MAELGIAPRPLQTRIYDNPFIQNPDLMVNEPDPRNDVASESFAYASKAPAPVPFDFAQAAEEARSGMAPAPEGLGLKTNLSPAMQNTMTGLGVAKGALDLGSTLAGVAKTAAPAAAGTAATIFGAAGIIPGIGTAIAGIGTIASSIANWYYARKQMKANEKAAARSAAIEDRAIAEEQRRYEAGMKIQKGQLAAQQKLLEEQSAREGRKEAYTEEMGREELALRKEAQAEAIKQNKLATAIQLMAGTTKFFNTPQGRMQYAQLWR